MPGLYLTGADICTAGVGGALMGGVLAASVVARKNLLSAILGGQALEGGHAGSLMQVTAGIIVIGGTVGATMVAYPKGDFLRGVKMAKAVFAEKPAHLPALLVRLEPTGPAFLTGGTQGPEGSLFCT